MRNEKRTFQSARWIGTTLGLAGTFLLSGLLVSCYSMPAARYVGDDPVVGRYSFDDPQDQFRELTLHEDGYFSEYVRYADGEEFNDFGVFFYSPETASVEFLYDDTTAKWNFTGVFDDGFSLFVVDEETYARDSRYLSDIGLDSLETASGIYGISYTTSESGKVVILLQLFEDGSFKEFQRHPDSDETESYDGSYSPSYPSGYTHFVFDEYPDAGFTAIIDVQRGLIRAIEGDYISLDDSKTIDELIAEF